MISAIQKTLQKTTQHISTLLGDKKDKITKEELESILIECDIDYDVIENMFESLPNYISRENLKNAMLNVLEPHIQTSSVADSQTDNVNESSPKQTLKPLVYLVIGVNGAGKTTTIAKLAFLAKNNGKKVLLAAGDTFRAAAIEQLKLWGERLSIQVIASGHLHDPSAVAFDSINAAIARGYDELYIDTAGRLENQINLKNELSKIVRVSQKAIQSKGSLNALLILDGTQGSAALNQVKAFSEIVKFKGIIVTKLDGTSKGGAIFSVVKELGVPILYLGVGEKAQDLIAFRAKDYVDVLLESIFRDDNGKKAHSF